jgi:predicted negative regulator of RcsB-dependent stress response
MKKILVLAILALAVWFGWTRFAPSLARPVAKGADTAPAADAQRRIDALSGAAPSE